MKNTGLMVLNNNVPCSCACKYCLFRSCKSAEGVSYGRGKELALRFAEWKATSDKDDFSISYAIGHCADYPELAENIAFNRKLGFVGATYLQINGIGFRDRPELIRYLEEVKEAGVLYVDTTFYGLEEYHDKFAARKGDFQFMIDIVKSVQSVGLTLQPTIVIFESNKDQIAQLLDLIEGYAGSNIAIHGFIQDYRGNGANVESIRLTRQSYDSLPEKVKETINISRYRTEADWLWEHAFADTMTRYLRLSLQPENIDMLEEMSSDDIIRYLIDLDEKYYSALPGIEVLADLYGDRTNQRLYRQRDLYWKWQKQYINDHKLTLHDVTDERICGSFRS